MKKILVLIVLLFVSISLYAQKPLIKIIDIDGNETKYNLEDIREMNFVKTNKLSTMFVYQPKITHKFLIANINSIMFSGNNKLTIKMTKLSKTLFIAEIDSIIIIPKNCSEVTIFNQTWTCKNLDVDHYRNGDPIPEVKDSAEWANLSTGAWCYYKNDPILGAIYGKLYNWYAVNDPRGLASDEWHIPSNSEWKILIYNLGGSVAGRKLKSTGILKDGSGLWTDASLNATDDYGFSALPGGARKDDASFNNISYGAYFWSADVVDDTRAYEYIIPSNYDNVSKGNDNFKSGHFVRFVKGTDCPDPIINSISPDTADIDDIITLKGENFCPPQGLSFVSFPYAVLKPEEYVSWSDTEIKVKVPIGTASGKISVTIYGIKSNEIDFVVKRKIESGSVKDNDGNEYKTIKLGNQWWMESNLKVKHYRNGDPIPEIKDSSDWFNLKTGAWCDYNNDPGMEADYGALYNWFTVNDPRGLAPAGWHIATDSDWDELITLFSGNSIAGSMLKDVGNKYWAKPNIDATNESEFSARPAGQRGYQGNFDYLGYFAYFWTYNEYDDLSANLKRLFYDGGQVGSYNNYKYFGYSVRCVKDAPTLLIPKINSVSPDPVSMGDILTISGENFGTKRDTNFVSIYSKKVPNDFYKSWSDIEIKVKVPKGPSESIASVTVNGWKSNDVGFSVVNTSYPPMIISISSDTTILTDIITIKGKNFGELLDSGYVMFNEIKPPKNSYISWNDSLIVLKIPVEFIKGNITVNVYGTKSADFYYAIKLIEYSTVTDVDGNLYKTVKIGKQWWMAENLKVLHYQNGDSINEVQDKSEWTLQKTAAWCNYNNDPKNGEIFGKLYNFYALNDIRRIAPKGWHVPSEVEWEILLKYCGGESIAGGKLKSTGTIQNGDGLWNSPNYGALNSSGFTGIPNGSRTADGNFYGINTDAYWWTRQKLDNKTSFYIHIYNMKVVVYIMGSQFQTGFAVRCVKDSENVPYISALSPDSISVFDTLTIVGSAFGDVKDTNYVMIKSLKIQNDSYVSWSSNEIRIIIPKDTKTGQVYVVVNGIISNKIDLKIILKTGTVKDIDGQIYKTIKIGDQWWMAQNLNVQHYRNGDSIPEIRDKYIWVSLNTGAWCYYDNSAKNMARYGKLYNWYAVIDIRGLAPEGWHIASNAEWTQQFEFLGGEKVAGAKLRDSGIGFWTAFGGCRWGEFGEFSSSGDRACWWTSTKINPTDFWYVSVSNDDADIYKGAARSWGGISIRCIKD